MVTTVRQRRARPNPLDALDAGSMSEIAKRLNLVSALRLGATTRAHGPTLRSNVATGLRDRRNSVKRGVDGLATKVTAMMTQLIAHRRKHGHQVGDVEDAYQSFGRMGDEGTGPATRLTASAWMQSTRHGNATLHIWYWLPPDVIVAAEVVYKIREVKGTYRLYAHQAFAFKPWNRANAVTRALLKLINARALTLYRQRPVTAW